MKHTFVYFIFFFGRSFCQSIITERSFQLVDEKGNDVKLSRKVGFDFNKLPWDEWISNNGGNLVIPREVLKSFPPNTHVKVIITSKFQSDSKTSLKNPTKNAELNQISPIYANEKNALVNSPEKVKSRNNIIEDLKPQFKEVKLTDSVKDMSAKISKNDNIQWMLSKEEKRFLLEEHNKVRRTCYPQAAGMKELSWDRELEGLAQQYARMCIYDHNEDRPKDVGENIAAKTGKRDVQFSTDVWKEESRHYNIFLGICAEGEACGHYTQLVWENTTLVGCAMWKCDHLENLGWKNAYFIVCNYAPGGNLKNKRPYEIGARCSQCDGDCRNDLCV